MPPETQTLHTLSVIAVVFNEAKHVAGLQRAIEQLILPEGVNVETILVDGGSSDGTPDIARNAGFSVVLSLPGANIPVCRNAGIKASKGDWIAFLDGDCEPDQNWLMEACSFLASDSPVLLGWPARPPEPMTWVQSAWLFHWLKKNHRTEDFAGKQVVLHEAFRLSTTRNMLFQRRVAENLGGFNEELATGEDTDFAYRAYLSGVRVIALPSLVVIHHGEPATLRQFYRQQLWHANRRSYEHIYKLSGGKVGGNAPRFAAAFLSTFVLAVLSLLGTLVTGHWSLAALCTPLIAVITLPAAIICARAKEWTHFPALCVLYAAYGLARSIDLAGLHKAKPSWKSKKAT